MKMVNCILVLVLVCYHQSNNAMRDSAYLYAPWRESYNNSCLTRQQSSVCPMCRISNQNAQAQDFVLLHTKNFVIALNAFPYSRGHLLLIPRAHAKSMQDLSANVRIELIELIADVATLSQKIFNCSGLNVGYNQGYNSSD
jgi:ATP adenylyltransferase